MYRYMIKLNGLKCKYTTFTSVIILFSIVLTFSLFAWIKFWHDRNEKVLISVPGKIETLDPGIAVDLNTKLLHAAIYAPLFRIVASQLVPVLADRWEYLPNKLELLIHIKKNLRFSDGTKLTAADVNFSIHYWSSGELMESQHLEPILGMKDYRNHSATVISGLEVVDSFTLKIRLTHNDPNFVKSLALPRFVILKKDFNSKSREAYFQSPITSGPFMVDSFDGTTLLLKRNSYYFGNIPRAKSIKLFSLSYSNALLAFKQRQLDNLLFYDVNSQSEVSDIDVVVDVLPPNSTVALGILNLPGVNSSKEFRCEIARQILASSRLRDCFQGSSAAVSYFPPIVKRQEIDRGMQNAVGKMNLSGADVEIYMQQDYLDRCPTLREPGVFESGKLKFADLDKMFELLKKRELKLFVEEFGYKGDNLFSMLQYFDPTAAEYILGDPIPGLEQLFIKSRHLSVLNNQNSLAGKIVQLLIQGCWVTPILYPASYRVYRSGFLGASTLLNYQSRVEWEQVGYE